MKKTPKREPSDKNNHMSLRPMLSGLQDLDTDSVTNLRSGLKMKNGFPIEIQMDTKVMMKMDWLKSKKVGVRVTCDGIRGTIPVGKYPAVASVVDSNCKVDLRIKIWKLSWWTPPSCRRALCSPCRTPKHRFYYSDSPPSPSRLQDLPRGADVPDGENIHRRRSSKEEAFFDSKPWLDSDCEDDFYSVNGDFTPSRGTTPVHHTFGTPSRSRIPGSISVAETSPEKKKKLLELFRESVKDEKVDDCHGHKAVKPTTQHVMAKSANCTPFISGANSTCSSERTMSEDRASIREKPVKSSSWCIPSLSSCRSFRERSRKTSPAIELNGKH